LWCVAAIVAALAIALATTPGVAFFVYYAASRSWLAGRLGPELYEAAWFAEQTAAWPGGVVPEHLRYSPPTVSLLTMPVAWMPPEFAVTAWGFISVLAAFAGVHACYRMAIALDSRVARRGVVLAGLALLSSPIRADFGRGQAYAVVFALVAVAIDRGRSHQSSLAGSLMGIAAVAKTYGAWPMAGWLVTGRWRPLAVATAVGVALVASTFLAEDAVSAWQRYMDIVRHASLGPDVAVTAYQSLPAFLSHMLRHDPRWNPEPIFDAPWLVRPMLLVAAIAVAAAALPRIRRVRSEIAGSFMLVAGLIFSPRVEDYHFALAIPAVFVGWALVRNGSRAAGAVWLVGAILLLFDMPYKAAFLSRGMAALLAYPRLYGAVIMGCLLLSGSSRAVESAVAQRRGADPSELSSSEYVTAFKN